MINTNNAAARINQAAVEINERNKARKEVERAKREPPPEPKQRQLKISTMAELKSKQLKPKKMLLSPWLWEGALTLASAPTGVGKSWLGLLVGKAVSEGSSIFDGRWEAQGQSRVLFVDGEMGETDLQERIRLLNIDENAGYFLYHTNVPDDVDDSIDTTVNLADAVWQAIILDKVKAEGISLIILDNVFTLYVTNENTNSPTYWNDMQRFILELRKAGVAVLLIDHDGKNPNVKSPIGTAAKSFVMNFTISLRQPEDYQEQEGARFIVTMPKHRSLHGADVRPFEAALVDGEWITEDYTPPPSKPAGRPTNDPNYDKVKKAVEEALNNNEPISPKKISEDKDVPLRSVNTYLRNIRTGWTGAGTTDYIADDYSDYQ